MAVITVLGAGMMGSALCVPLADRGHEVRLVGTFLDGDIIARLQEDHYHLTLRHPLPEPIRPFAFEQLGAAMAGTDVIALGVSSAGAAWAGEQIAPYARRDRPIFMITKGLHWTGSRLEVMPDVVRQQLPKALRDEIQPAAVAGPCIAGELLRRVPTCVVLTGRDRAVLRRLAALLSTDYYHLWLSSDVIGVEACAALKNAYAMGVALGAGLHERRGGQPAESVAMHNLESAVFAQAIWEMQTLIAALGGDPASAAWLPGTGDLDVTNNGGRTGRFGRLLGLGLTVDEAVERMAGATLECLEIIKVLRRATTSLVQADKLAPGALPLLEHLAEVVLDGAAVALPFEQFFSTGLKRSNRDER